MSGLRPKRNFVPGTRSKPSMMMASHLKSDSSPESFRDCRFSGGRTSHSGIFDFRSSIFDCNAAPNETRREDACALQKLRETGPRLRNNFARAHLATLHPRYVA